MRTEHAGAFNNLLYERVLTDMLRSPAFNAELMGARWEAAVRGSGLGVTGTTQVHWLAATYNIRM